MSVRRKTGKNVGKERAGYTLLFQIAWLHTCTIRSHSRERQPSGRSKEKDKGRDRDRRRSHRSRSQERRHESQRSRSKERKHNGYDNCFYILYLLVQFQGPQQKP